ncbi:MAG: hypothetical protein BroJett038_25770 [Chloroflexota bacterium]|nr:MAG: hypothetical protein BroJett038_25770 [Chloroflexota bacterium]
MFPIFIPPESDQNPRMRRRAKLSLVIGLTVAVLIPLLFRSGAASPFSWVVFTLVIIMGIAGLLAVFAVQRSTLESEKHKREGVDMYTLIDRLVDELDEDEAAYLRRRLDDRERGLEETPLEDALKQTLDRREDDRLAGRR